MTQPLTPDQPLSRRSTFEWPTDWRRRLIVGGVAALVVFVVTFEVARRAQRGPVAMYTGQGTTMMMVRQLQQHVDAFTLSTGQPPAHLADVPEIKQQWTGSDQLVDGWGTPFGLVTIDGKPTVISYGADRVPGGVGIDADLIASRPMPEMTRRQFIRHAPIVPVLLICAAASVMTLFATFYAGTSPRDRSPPSWVGLLVLAVFTGAAATVVGFFMAVLHAPSGH